MANVYEQKGLEVIRAISKTLFKSYWRQKTALRGRGVIIFRFKSLQDADNLIRALGRPLIPVALPLEYMYTLPPNDNGLGVIKELFDGHDPATQIAIVTEFRTADGSVEAGNQFIYSAFTLPM